MEKVSIDMRQYLLVEGSEIYDFPVILFVDDGERITVYSDDLIIRNSFQDRVSDYEQISLRDLQTRFPYCEAELVEITDENRTAVEQIIKNLSTV